MSFPFPRAPALQLTRMRAIQARIEWHSFWIYVASTHVVPEPGCPRHPGNGEDATGDDDGEDATGDDDGEDATAGDDDDGTD